MSKRTRQGLRTASKYIFLEAVGIILFKFASAYALAQRGYIAVGGEYFLLLMPLIYKLTADMAHGMAQAIKETLDDWQEERADRTRRNHARALQRTAQERSNR